MLIWTSSSAANQRKAWQLIWRSLENFSKDALLLICNAFWRYSLSCRIGTSARHLASYCRSLPVMPAWISSPCEQSRIRLGYLFAHIPLARSCKEAIWFEVVECCTEKCEGAHAILTMHLTLSLPPWMMLLNSATEWPSGEVLRGGKSRALAVSENGESASACGMSRQDCFHSEGKTWGC